MGIARAVVIALLSAGIAAGATPATASAAPRPTITPGVLLTTQLDDRTASECTANFVFRGPDATYLGFSAHCASTGDDQRPSGCVEHTLPLGSTVLIGDGEQARGRLAYSSWRTMQARSETDPALCELNDFALVELDPADLDRMGSSVPELGGPTGLDTDGTVRGERVYSYQPHDGATAVKAGSSLGDSDGGLTHRVSTTPPGIPGDSGSGFLDADGRAFGVLSTQFFDRERTNGVTDLALALDYADRFGGIGTVELVPGTAPFSP